MLIIGNKSKEVDYKVKPHFGHQYIVNGALEGKMKCCLCGREFTWSGKTLRDEEPKFCFDKRVMTVMGTTACKDYYEEWLKHKERRANKDSGLNLSEAELKQRCDGMFKILLGKGLVC